MYRIRIEKPANIEKDKNSNEYNAFTGYLVSHIPNQELKENPKISF